MRKFLKRLAVFAGVVAVVAVGFYGAAWWHAKQATSARYVVDDPPLVLRGDATERARGEHLYTVLGCGECHGEGGVGRVAIDAGPVGRFVAPNLTPAALAGRYDADRLAAAIRHAVAWDGRPLWVMPSADFAQLSDTDTAALVAYLQALPPSANRPGRSELKPLGQVLFLLGKVELTAAATLDHTPRPRTAPPAGPTPEYGAYLAQACTGCHGSDFAGQHVPGTPPEFPDAANLTPHANGLRDWQLADFLRALRTGKRPDGRELAPFMPWRAYQRMSDDEIEAIWLHLRTLPPSPGQRG